MTTFALDINKFIKKTGGNADKVVRELCFNLLKDIVYNTPVDSGRAKAN